MDKVSIGPGDGPRLANRGASLGDNAGQADSAADGDGHGSFVINTIVQVNLSSLFGIIAAGQATQSGQGSISLVPAFHPMLGIQGKGIREHEPPIGLLS